MATNSSSSIQNINNWRLWTQKNKHNDYSIIDKIYLYVKDPDEPKYQYLIKKSKNK